LNTVVALMCESVDAAGRGSGRAGDNAGGARLAAVRQHAGVTPAGLDGLLAGELAALAAGRPGATLILGGVPAAGGQLPPVVPPGVARVILAPPEQPYTGLWWELAGGLAGWSAEGRQVLLAGYDEALGYLSLAAFEAGPS
jgi:4-hydroxymandelate oxidase